ncbi:MAG: hypothetical protein AAF613_01150 [Pseudomonadota bacterium]
MRSLFLGVLLALAWPASAQDGASDTLSGAEAWAKIYEIASHPRCANCHVGADNIPRWSGVSYGLAPGEWRYHGMNVNAGMDRIGNTTLPCATCHQMTNSDVPHGPPGAHVWALAPVEMEWFGKSSAEVCAQIKDPARNGGRSIADVAGHIDHDELVHWGWDPGPGREPAPYSAKEMVVFVEVWGRAGAPCPAPETIDYLRQNPAGDQ